MKIVKSYAVILNSEERDAVITTAKALEDGFSDSSYIEIIEQMLFDAFILGTEEPMQKDDS